MFNLFKKDPAKKLQSKYESLLKEAMELQRKGDIKGYALKTEAAEKVAEEIEKLKKE